MKRNFKNLLEEAFRAPEPKRKQEFLKKLSIRRISFRQFMWIQTAYIKKSTWLLSFGIFTAALVGGGIFKKNMLWFLSAMMPILAVSAIAESSRSELYGMAELEMATRFSLRSVVLARMGILGVLHYTVLCAAAILGGDDTFLQMGVYLLVPYLLTDVGGLWLARKFHGREAFYACLCLVPVVGILPLISEYLMQAWYHGEAFGWWVAALAVLCIAAAVEWIKRIRGTEEMTWNSI